MEEHFDLIRQKKEYGNIPSELRCSLFLSRLCRLERLEVREADSKSEEEEEV